MNKSETNNKGKLNIRSGLLDIVFTAMFVAIIAVCAQIQIPIGPVPFTLQTLGVFAAAGLLGWKRGTAAILVYVLLGLVGVPVFAGFSGGLSCIVGPTGGYIIGFIFTALIVGLMCDKLGRKLWVAIVSKVIGLAVCYAFGTAWFCVSTSTGILDALLICVVPFLIADAVKIAVASLLVNNLDRVIKL